MSLYLMLLWKIKNYNSMMAVTIKYFQTFLSLRGHQAAVSTWSSVWQLKKQPLQYSTASSPVKYCIHLKAGLWK